MSYFVNGYSTLWDKHTDRQSPWRILGIPITHQLPYVCNDLSCPISECVFISPGEHNFETYYILSFYDIEPNSVNITKLKHELLTFKLMFNNNFCREINVIYMWFTSKFRWFKA